MANEEEKSQNVKPESTSKKEKLPMPESPIPRIQPLDGLSNDTCNDNVDDINNNNEINNMNEQPHSRPQLQNGPSQPQPNYQQNNNFYPQQQSPQQYPIQHQPQHYQYHDAKLVKRNFWTNGLSVNETRISALVVAFIVVVGFALFMYAKHGDISPTLASIIQWIVMGIAGINIGGMVGGMFGSTSSMYGSSMYGGMYGSFGTYSNSTSTGYNANAGYNNSGYNNSGYNTTTNPATTTTTNSTSNNGAKG